MNPTKKILMVCLGNICRSPMAEGLLAHYAKAAGKNWLVDSAGTNSYHIGQAPHPLSIKVAAQNGIDLSHQRARSFLAKDMEQYDIIYAMATDVLEDIKHIAGNTYNPKKVILFATENEGSNILDVPDPWYGEEDGYHKVFDLIKNTCEAIIKKYE